jgi:quinoprotein glucose dehydrogenase
MSKIVAAAIVLLAFISGSCRPAWTQIGNAGATADWPVYGGQPADDHYSALAQIDKKNVAKLHVVWQFDTGSSTTKIGARLNSVFANPTLVC